MSGLSLGTLVPNLKSVSLTVFELLAFNSHDRPLRTHTHTQTNVERTHYLRHSLRSLGGDNNVMIAYRRIHALLWLRNVCTQEMSNWKYLVLPLCGILVDADLRCLVAFLPRASHSIAAVSR